METIADTPLGRTKPRCVSYSFFSQYFLLAIGFARE
jgi:hypothetical protein